MTNNNKQPSDFNDLQHSSGIEEVKSQLLEAVSNSAIDAANDSDLSKPPTPSSKGGDSDLGSLLKRYAYVLPDGKIWDYSKRRLIKEIPFKKSLGAKLFGEWLDHEGRKTEDIDDVTNQEAAAQKEGGGGLGAALNRYVYIYPTESAWDRKKSEVISISSLRLAIADVFSFWVTHPLRDQIDQDKLVFDPAEKVDLDTHINMFTGIKTKPKANIQAAAPIFQLVSHLCNGDKQSYKFLLDWIAYPLQFPGSKMASAILMHSETHGSGKSLLFEECVKSIYSEYGATLGQHQLESQYTDWRSKLLFALFEEIFSRDQKYSHTGTIKHMITGKTHRIEKKFVSGWEESNFMNAVFLSNEIQPFPLEPSDRRFLVIWPRTKLSQELNDEVVEALKNGGMEAFYYELLQRDLSDMTTHTEPPVTEAKRFLIDFGRPTWDIFYREWENGELDIPFQSCLVGDLFKAYRIWCSERHEHCMGQNKFTGLVASRLRRRQDVHYIKSGAKKKGTLFQVGEVPKDETQMVWLGESIDAFKLALHSMDPAQMP